MVFQRIRSFDTEKPLHRESFTHRSFYTHKLFHRSFYTEKLLSTGAFTHRRLYTQKLVHTEAFRHRSFYTEKPLHTDAFPQKIRAAFTHFKKSQVYVSFWRSAIISCERVASGVGKSHFFWHLLTLDNHFAWKGCAWPCKIAIFFTSLFRAKNGCAWRLPDVPKWIKSQFYTNSWMFASDVKKTSVFPQLLPYDFHASLAFELSKSQFYTSKFLMVDPHFVRRFSFCHVFGCPTCAVSAEGCPCPKEIHIPPHVWAFENVRNARSPQTVAAGKEVPHFTTPHVCPSDTHDLRRGLPKDKTRPAFRHKFGCPTRRRG